MNKSYPFTEQVRNILAIAAEEARGMNHGYVGTEHVLLGLVSDGSNAARVLHEMGAGAPKVRAEIEKLVTRGSEPVSQGDLSQTPRLKLALEFAAQEVRFLQQNHIEAEHLLLGLLREPAGVAGQVIRNLGVRLPEVWQEVLKVRLTQMKIVERAVRPVRASAAQKRKMREELLAHLATIYEAEHSRLHDSVTAMEETSKRFGDPAVLSRELERSLPAHQRWEYSLERWFGWRAPESATRYMARVALLMVLVIAIGFIPLVLATVTHLGWDRSVWTALRPGLMILVLVPALQFAVGCLYFRMRNTLWGMFGACRSRLRVLLLGALMALSITAAGFAFIASSLGNVSQAFADLPGTIAFVAIPIAAFYYFLARVRGPEEISDTLWACLEIDRPIQAC